MPENHRQVSEWDGKQFVRWAKTFGESTQIVIERLSANHKVEQQAYNGCRSILKLADQYSPHELEVACQKAFTLINAPRYKNIRLIIQANQTKMDYASKTTTTNDQSHGFLRGNHYYREEENK